MKRMILVTLFAAACSLCQAGEFATPVRSFLDGCCGKEHCTPFRDRLAARCSGAKKERTCSGVKQAPKACDCVK